jgi:uncharacterized SAM-binding protein YcdF (DUF218 family)
MSISRLLDPALLGLLAVGLGVFLRVGRARAPRRKQRLGLALALGAWCALWLLASPWCASALVRRVELPPTDLDAALAGVPPEKAALVVLGGGLRDGDAVPPSERLDASSTARAIGAARVAREHAFGLVIVSGAPPELGRGMADLLVQLGVDRARIALESRSSDTKENAVFSTAIARERGIEHVVVVTSAYHMRRALWLFRRAGVEAVPAPVDFFGRRAHDLDSALPSSHALWVSALAVHEILGRLEP